MSHKIEHILSCAMNILKESGAQGLTMRRVADSAGMRLSNVQYYFKTKELLLGALLDGFLVDYAKSMHLLSLPDDSSTEKKLCHLTFYILNDIENSDCAVVFKEIWAIAVRNNLVKESINTYYNKLYKMLYKELEKAAANNCQPQQLDKAVAILLPFIEGYCITFSNIRISTKILSEQLANILCKLLQ